MREESIEASINHGMLEIPPDTGTFHGFVRSKPLVDSQQTYLGVSDVKDLMIVLGTIDSNPFRKPVTLASRYGYSAVWR